MNKISSTNASVSNIKTQSNRNSALKNVTVDYYEEFRDFYIFPHEFLCLICNSHDRLSLMESDSDKLKQEAEKVNFATGLNRNSEKNRLMLYKLDIQEMKTDDRPS